MLSYTGVVLYSVFIAILLPITIGSLLTGSKPLTSGPLAKFYVAEPNLQFAGDLFLLTVCANGLSRIAVNVGLISQATLDQIEPLIMVPFFGLLLSYLALWIRAAIKLRRAAKAG